MVVTYLPVFMLLTVGPREAGKRRPREIIRESEIISVQKGAVVGVQGRQLDRRVGPDGVWPHTCAAALATGTHCLVTKGTVILNTQLWSPALWV